MQPKKIGVVGTGYVGLVGGVCLADFGNKVINVDIDEEKIAKLNNGHVPIYEPGLEGVIKKVVDRGMIEFTTDFKYTVENSEVLFIAVGTPPREDGSADLKHVLTVARDIGRHMNGYKVVVDKSTVPVGTGQLVKATIREELHKRGVDFEFDVVSNPEFLREGKAVDDFYNPDRIVIGGESEKALEIMKEAYRALYDRKVPFLFTNIETAEIIKYASNAFLATKISFINEISRVCESLNADVRDVARGMGMDARISPQFLQAGCGYGGSCFPKDTQALVHIARANGLPMAIVEAAIKANEEQKMHMVKKIKDKIDELKGKTIGVLGLSFKPETDDMREAPALTIIPALIQEGAKIKAFCPEGMKEARWRLEEFQESIEYQEDPYAAIEKADALILLTEWNQFKDLDLLRIKNLLRGRNFFDFRNVYSREKIEGAGLEYTGVGTSGENKDVISYLNQAYGTSISGE